MLTLMKDCPYDSVVQSFVMLEVRFNGDYASGSAPSTVIYLNALTVGSCSVPALKNKLYIVSTIVTAPFSENVLFAEATCRSRNSSARRQTQTAVHIRPCAIINVLHT